MNPSLSQNRTAARNGIDSSGRMAADVSGRRVLFGISGIQIVKQNRRAKSGRILPFEYPLPPIGLSNRTQFIGTIMLRRVPAPLQQRQSRQQGRRRRQPRREM